MRVRPLVCMIGMAAAMQAAAATPVAAQQQGIAVGHGGADTLRLQPGERGSVPFTVANRGQQRRSIAVRAELPAGWRGFAAPAEIALPADSQVVRITSFVVPTDAPAGRYLVTLSVNGVAADSVFVAVGVQARLDVRVEEAPEWTPAGGSHAVRFRVINSGNVSSNIRLQLESGAGFAVRADTTARTLAPGQSTLVDVAVRTPSDLRTAMRHTLLLRARGAPDTATAAATARVEVLPQAGREATPRYGLPGELRVRISDDPRAGPPLSVHVGGLLRQGGSTRMDLLLQGPAQGYSMFGEADVYRLSLESPHGSVRLGDQVFALSPLTEPGKEGFGGELRARLGPVVAGAYLQQDRRAFRPDTQQAAFVHLSLGEPGGIRLNWLRRESERGRREVVSTQALVVLPGWLRVEGEYGIRPDRDAAARSIHARAGRRLLSVDLRHLRADTAFGGAYGGAAVDAAHVALRSDRDLYVEGSVERNAFTRGQGHLTYMQSFQTARVRAGYGSRIQIEGLHTRRSSLFGGFDVQRESRSARLRLGTRIRNLSLYPTVEAGLVSEPEAAEQQFWRAALQAQVAAALGTVSGSAEYSEGASVYHRGGRETISGTLSSSLRIGPLTRMQMGIYGTRELGGPGATSSLVSNGAIEHQFGSGHRVAARLRSRLLSGRFQSHETVVLLDYSIPFSVPAPARALTGGAAIVGRIYDAETGEPLPRVLLELGGVRAVADAEGRFAFRGLAAGTHHLRLELASVGLDRVPLQPMPLAIPVTAGERAELQLGVTRAAHLTARVGLARAVSLRGDTAGAVPMDTVPLAGAVLDFLRDDQRIRRTTDADGRILLSGLRPGRWTVVPVYVDVPPLHRLRPDSITVDLTAGAERNIEFTVAPVERRIQIIAGGNLTEQPADAARVAVTPADTLRAPRAARASEPPRPRRPAQVPPARTPPPTRARAASDSVAPLPAGWTTFRAEGSATTLMEVARRVYLETGLWPKIWLANRARVPDPGKIEPGLLLRIPPKAPLTQAEERAYRQYYRRDWQERESAGRTPLDEGSPSG